MEGLDLLKSVIEQATKGDKLVKIGNYNFDVDFKADVEPGTKFDIKNAVIEFIAAGNYIKISLKEEANQGA